MKNLSEHWNEYGSSPILYRSQQPENHSAPERIFVDQNALYSERKYSVGFGRNSVGHLTTPSGLVAILNHEGRLHGGIQNESESGYYNYL